MYQPRAYLSHSSVCHKFDGALFAGWLIARRLSHARTRTCANGESASSAEHCLACGGKPVRICIFTVRRSNKSIAPRGTAPSEAPRSRMEIPERAQPGQFRNKRCSMIEFAGPSPIFDTVQTVRPVGRARSGERRLSLSENYAVHLHSIMILLAVSRRRVLPHPRRAFHY
jgi:hypothetical protein